MAYTEAASLTSFWDYFDRIYCITVEGRQDRRQQAEHQFRKVGLGGRVTFVTVRAHPHNSEQGIYESHLTCLRRGLAQGADHMVIFEDDVVFDGFAQERLAAAVAFMQSRPDWNMFFFGCLVKGSRSVPHRGVVAIQYRSLAHAYAVRSVFAERLINKPWQGIPFDAMLSGLNDGFYAAYPAFAFQSNAPTDNTRRLGLDRIRRWCGGFRRIQKVNEWTRRHISLLVGIHMAVIGMLIGLVWWAVNK